MPGIFSTSIGSPFGNFVYADNASYDGTKTGGGLAQDGDLWIGSSAGRPVRVGRITGSSNITVTYGNGTIALDTASQIYTNVTNAMSPYTVLDIDQYISVDCSAGAVSLLFPNVPTALRTWVVKDRTGNSATNNISITTVGGAVTIDGQTTLTLASNYSSVNLLANATPTYEVH